MNVRIVDMICLRRRVNSATCIFCRVNKPGIVIPLEDEEQVLMHRLIFMFVEVLGKFYYIFKLSNILGF